MVENLKREKSEKEAQLSALENDMDTRKGDALTLSAEKEKLEKEQASWRLRNSPNMMFHCVVLFRLHADFRIRLQSLLR